MTLKLVEGDIFHTRAQFIAHQCNCISNNAAGLAYLIFTHYPYANCYSERENPSEPGTIQLCGDGLILRGVINMFAQYYPGKPNKDSDSIEKRKKWFHQCLIRISEIPNLTSIAFPARIGCGLAGGDWEWYSGQIEKFSEFMQKTEVLIYQRKED